VWMSCKVQSMNEAGIKLGLYTWRVQSRFRVNRKCVQSKNRVRAAHLYGVCGAYKKCLELAWSIRREGV
jgi:hypothetical protein